MAKPLGTRSPAHIEAQDVIHDILTERGWTGLIKGEEKASAILTDRGILNQQIDNYGEKGGLKLGVEIQGRVGHRKTRRQYFKDLHKVREQWEQHNIRIASLLTEDVVGPRAHPKEILIAEIEYQTGIKL